MNYTYDASGNKLKVATTVSGTTTATDYANGFVYNTASGTTALSFFPSPEGRVVKNGSNYEYQYAITDHQGNTRVLFTSATATVQATTATFESSNQGTESTQFSNYGHISGIHNHTSGGQNSQFLNGSSAGMVGVAKSYKVYPGDQLKIEAYGSYNAPGSSGSSLANFAPALIAALGLPTPAVGETGTAASAINTWGGLEAGGFGDGTNDNTDPKAFVNIVLFDKNYNFLDVAYAQLKGTSLYYMTASYTVKEAGYAYLYVSNEQPVQTDVYFDDVTMTYTPTNILQSNDYYAFGLQHATSWTRDNVNNNFLYDAGSELNNTTGMYDLPYRNYDATLGRFFQVDALSHQSHNLNPYHYAANNPIGANDPSGLNVDYSTSMENPDYVRRLQEQWATDHMNSMGPAQFQDMFQEFDLSGGPHGGSNSATSVVKWTDGKYYTVTVDIDGTYHLANADNPTQGVDLGDFIGVINVRLVNEPVIGEADLKQGYGNNGGDELTQDDNYGGGKYKGTLKEFAAMYSGCTIEEIQNEVNPSGQYKSQLGGPGGIKFVEDPLNPGKYIDMKHMLIVGYKWGDLGGLAVELFQLVAYPKSAFEPQDFYSNHLGERFEYAFGNQLDNSTNFVNYLTDFLTSKFWREDFSRIVK